MVDAIPLIGAPLRRALALISNHPAVRKVGSPSCDHTSGAISIDVTFEVSLPNEWRQSGKSPSGVRLEEDVRFDFSSGFPMDPPRLSLRADFGRDFPHMQPWLTDGRPVPCIYDGDIAELLHQEGLAGILNQTVVWLERAALGTLIDPKQGWEPVRRDFFSDYLVADADGLCGLVNRDGGHRFFELVYLKSVTNGHVGFIHGHVSSEEIRLSPGAAPRLFKEAQVNGDSQLRWGKSLVLVVWSGKHPSGKLIVNDTYLPEEVESVADLKKRANMYGCANEFNSGLKRLKHCLSRHPKAGPFTMAVVFLARRPFKVIGSQSPIELCPYVVDICFPTLFAAGDTTTVRPAAHLHAISRSLLAQMAGSEVMSEQPWTIVGAGSLGSKLALHLARAGNGPEVVIDRSVMAPHNAARHALTPTTGDMQLLWMRNKAQVLCEALHGLDQNAIPIPKDVASVLMSKGDARRAWSKRSWAVVNTTASSVVRESLAVTELMTTRVIETSLFAGGLVGMITIEGPNRNPNTADMIAEYYAFLQMDSTLASIVFGSNDAMSRQNIGQGCGSLTMAMSDGRLSLFAAGMSEYMLARQRDGLPDKGGEVLIGRLSDDGFGLEWYTHQIPPVTVVKTKSGERWRVHIHARATKKIQVEVARWPGVETGGVLMGRLSEASRTIHVVDVLDPPDDSVRSAREFVLGTKGLRQQICAYSETVDWSLYCLGTWHSHLSSCGPSPTDRATAEAVSLARLTPSIFLIKTPVDFYAFSADVESDHGERD